MMKNELAVTLIILLFPVIACASELTNSAKSDWDASHIKTQVMRMKMMKNKLAVMLILLLFPAVAYASELTDSAGNDPTELFVVIIQPLGR